MFSIDEDKSQVAEDGDYYLEQKQTNPSDPASRSSSAAQLGDQLEFHLLQILIFFWEINFGKYFGCLYFYNACYRQQKKQCS